MQFNNVVVGQVIKKLRTEKNMTQELLSGFAGIARTHLTMIEKGDKKANFETLWRIAIALDMKPSQLVACIEKTVQEQDDNGK